VRDTLRVKGYQTIETETGEEGVRLAHERHPALILTDIQLPGISGIDALGQLRADPTTRAIAVIAIGEPSPSILDECSRPGGRGATFSVDGCSRRSAEVPEHQSSFPSCFRTNCNRTLLVRTRGIAATLAGALRS
jgi:hypothetical protein